MIIDLSTPIQTARFLVRLDIYRDEQIEAAVAKEFSLTPEEARTIVAQAIEFDDTLTSGQQEE